MIPVTRPDEVIVVRNMDDLDQVYRMFHRCPEGAAEEDDVLEFPVGLAGMGYPAMDIRSWPSMTTCPACGRPVTRRFRWAFRRQLLLP